MGIPKNKLHRAIRAVALKDAAVGKVLDDVGLPEARTGEPGFPSLLRIMVGQQLSVKAAASIHGRLVDLLDEVTPEVVMSQSDEALRGIGFSRQKVIYARSLANAVLGGELDFIALADMKDKEAMEAIIEVKGFGAWSAEIYLLFCEGRMDTWPAGDLALQVAVQSIRELAERPTAKETIPLVKAWQPYRGAMAVFLWHYYNSSDGAPI